MKACYKYCSHSPPLPESPHFVSELAFLDESFEAPSGCFTFHKLRKHKARNFGSFLPCNVELKKLLLFTNVLASIV